MLSKTKNQLEGVNMVSAGYFEGKQYADGTEIATVAMENEYGTDTKPARPFISNAESKNNKKWKNIFDKEMDNGKTLPMALSRIGEEIRNDIIREIDSNLPPPNSQETIKRKGSSHTLIDTGTMKRSVEYSLEKG